MSSIKICFLLKEGQSKGNVLIIVDKTEQKLQDLPQTN